MRSRAWPHVYAPPTHHVWQLKCGKERITRAQSSANVSHCAPMSDPRHTNDLYTEYKRITQESQANYLKGPRSSDGTWALSGSRPVVSVRHFDQVVVRVHQPQRVQGVELPATGTRARVSDIVADLLRRECSGQRMATCGLRHERVRPEKPRVRAVTARGNCWPTRRSDLRFQTCS